MTDRKYNGEVQDSKMRYDERKQHFYRQMDPRRNSYQQHSHRAYRAYQYNSYGYEDSMHSSYDSYPKPVRVKQRQQEFYHGHSKEKYLEKSHQREETPTQPKESASVAEQAGLEAAEWPSLSKQQPHHQQPQQIARPASQKPRDSPVRAPAPSLAVRPSPATSAVATASSSVPSSSSSPGASLPSAPLPLLTQAGHFADDAGAYLDPSNTNFAVVGAVGLHGVGKSGLLNGLLDSGLSRDRRPRRRHFPTQTVDCVSENSFKTKGVQLHLSSSRWLLLDSEPLLALGSAEPLIQAAASERRSAGPQPEFITVETGATMHGLQLCSFLMSVCHVLVVVLDSWVDCELLRLLQIGDMLRPAALEDTNFQPRVLFVLNKCSGQPACVSAVRQSASATLRSFFDSATFLLDADDLVCLPLLDGSKAAADLYAEEMERLRVKIFTSPRHHMLKHELFNEKVWLQFASQVWDGVQKSVMLTEYHRLIG